MTQPARSTRVYLSSDFSRRSEMRAVADALRRHGHLVTSSWQDQSGGDDLDAPGAGLLAGHDLAEVRQCEVFVAYTTGQKARGGRHAEMGAAAVLGKRLILVGPVEHHFHRLPQVERVDTTAAMIRAVGGAG